VTLKQKIRVTAQKKGTWLNLMVVFFVCACATFLLNLSFYAHIDLFNVSNPLFVPFWTFSVCCMSTLFISNFMADANKSAAKTHQEVNKIE
jgi:hypothetical protein